MAMVTDPVCGMRIDAEDAAATVEHDGKTYYFCSETCRDVFVADPSRPGLDAISGMHSGRVTMEELAEGAGTSVEHVRELAELGILESE
jgi:YHS domain-containing protein